MINREELHRYYDALEMGICLILQEGERILFANRSLVLRYGCGSEKEFLDLTGGTFSGMTTSKGLQLGRVCAGQTGSIALHFGFQTKELHFREADAVVTLQELEGIPCYCVQIAGDSMERQSDVADRLTGFPGARAFFQGSLERAKRNMEDGTFQNWCPACVNIANFRGFNRENGTEEGDKILAHTARILRESFPEGYFGHPNADTFYALLPKRALQEKLNAACMRVNRLLGEGGSACKAGIVMFDGLVSSDMLRHSFDMAKIACDSIKSVKEQNVAVFRRQMQEQLELRQYILRHFEDALQQGYIKIYYQPIIRTATEEICGFEALSRWEDPAKGMISPGVFVPVLEKARLVGHLDAYLIDRVARFQKERKQSGKNLLPISLNLSRLDFTLIQPEERVTQACDAYKIPADCICCEITERMVAENREEMDRVIHRFHQAGHEIWLDDFGAEYSSLNALHRFAFDLIKLDMGFFQKFDEKSRAILTNLVSMAKDLGMHTLAEGVETREQVDFLRAIGCERIQGYYYAKPMPFAQILLNMRAYGMENELERSIFDAVGLANLVSQTPTSFFFVNGQKLILLEANDAFLPELHSGDCSTLARTNERLSQDSSLRRHFLAYADKIFRDGAGDMIYVLQGQYVRFHAEKIAGVEHFWAGKCTLINMRFDREILQARRLDRVFRYMISDFDSITLADPGQNTLTVFSSSYRRLESLQTIPDLDRAIASFARSFVMDEDRERFLSFYRETLGETRIRENLFRVRGKDGNYSWCVYTAVPIREEGKKQVLYCSRATAFDREASVRELIPLLVSSFPGHQDTRQEPAVQLEASLFRAISGETDLPIYWKDTSQRYLGANAAFGELVGVFNTKTLAGKTAQELGLYLDTTKPRNQEQQVLGGEEASLYSERTFLAGGKIRTARFLEVPFYQGSRIGGLVGIGADALGGRHKDEDAADRVLECTGILSAGIAFDDALRSTGEGYCAVLLLLENYAKLCEVFGEEVGSEAGDRVQDAVCRAFLPQDVVAGRLSVRAVLLLSGDKGAEAMVRASVAVQNEIEAIRGIGGTPCRLKLMRTVALGREAASFPDLLRLLSKRADPARSRERAMLEEVWHMIGITPEMLEQIPERAALLDPVTREVVSVNKSLRRDLDLQDDYPVAKKKCYELFRERTSPCSDCLLLGGAQAHCLSYQGSWAAGHSYRFQCVPVRYLGRALTLVLASPLQEEPSYGSLILDSETWANEAITTGLEAKNPTNGIEKCIAHIAENLKSERFFLFEIRKDGTASCSFEWTREGLLPWKEELQSVLLSDLSALNEIFRTNKVAIVEDYAAFVKQHPDFVLPIPGIRNFISGCLQISGERLGFTLVLNSPDCRPAGYMLSTLTDFLAVMLRNRNNLQEAYEQSLRDPMTGVCNRRGLERYLAKRTDTGSAVFVSGDINGLKDRNDSLGHEAGDGLIRQAADILIRAADRDHVFRMGGDEFLLIREGMDEAGARQMIREIRFSCTESGCSMALGYVVKKGKIRDVDAVLREADLAMYEDKGKSHRRRRTDPKD